MPLPHAGAEGARSRRARREAVLRGVGFGMAVALGAVAVWLIVTSTSQKRIELGILAGLWGLLLGTFAAFGSRRLPSAGDPAGENGRALALRAHTELERADESAARLRFEARLEQMLRQEIQTTFGREIAALRGEVASLRNELLEKVGGQLRLERIETTRVIGSDIEALYREIDQLKHGSGSRTVHALPVGPPPEPAERPAVPEAERPAVPQPEPAAARQHEAALTQPIALVDDDPREPSEPPDGPEAARPQPEASRPEPPAARPQPPNAPVPAEPVPAAPSEPAVAERRPDVPTGVLLLPPPGSDGDPFADLPRLSPFADDGPDFGSASEPAPTAPPREAPSGHRPGLHHPTPGRHGLPDSDQQHAGGRRRRAPDAEDNVLARILARESADR